MDHFSDNEGKQRLDSYTSEDEVRPSLNRSTSESLNFYSNNQQQSYEENYDDVYGKKRTLSCTSEDEPDYKRKKFQRLVFHSKFVWIFQVFNGAEVFLDMEDDFNY